MRPIDRVIEQVNMTAIVRPISEVFGQKKSINWGIPALVVTFLIWAGFFISLRQAAQSTLMLADVALIRFGLAALILLPFTIKQLPAYRQVKKRYLFGLFVGSGLPYFLVAGTGMRFASVAEGSTLIPGLIPLFVSGMAVLFYREQLSRTRKLGLLLIAFGASVMVGFALLDIESGHWRGHLIFIMCAFLWAYFTVSMRMAGLKPLQATSFILWSSFIVLVPLVLVGVFETNLVHSESSDIWFQVIVQGLGVGFIASITYTYAISKLGAEVSAALGSLTPVIASVIAIPVLGESIDVYSIIGMVLIMLGVVCASGVIDKTKLKRKEKN
jgi:drug/metabolite transporter (DMT)-like permease